MIRLWLSLMFGFILLGAGSTAFAQGTATFNGRVTDTSGAVCSGSNRYRHQQSDGIGPPDNNLTRTVSIASRPCLPVPTT
jgi:hypothetical protein